MSRYALHPEAFSDLDNIREHIAVDNPDAADRIVTEIFDVVRSLVEFPDQGYRRPNLHFAPAAVQTGAGICDRLRAGEETVVGGGSDPRTPQPPCDGRDFERPGISP
jgi:plasmid stabilization system protein ParE